MWQPDGWGQIRIGVLTPHADIVPETEFNALTPDGISIHAARIPSVGGLIQFNLHFDGLDVGQKKQYPNSPSFFQYVSNIEQQLPNRKSILPHHRVRS